MRKKSKNISAIKKSRHGSKTLSLVMNNYKIYAGYAEKDFALQNIRLHSLESVIYNIGYYLGKALVISGIHRE